MSTHISYGDKSLGSGEGARMTHLAYLRIQMIGHSDMQGDRHCLRIGDKTC